MKLPHVIQLCRMIGNSKAGLSFISSLEHYSLIWGHLMVPNQFIRLGTKRGAMRGIGQALKRRRWTDLAHRRPAFRARWTSLMPTCGRKDHGVDLASPANAKNRSNDSI